jgi:SRSO17 transposase
VDAAALTDVGERLDSFVDQVFSSLTRKDQRATAGVYARGLILDGRRKSMQPMAQRLGIDHQLFLRTVRAARGHLAMFAR